MINFASQFWSVSLCLVPVILKYKCCEISQNPVEPFVATRRREVLPLLVKSKSIVKRVYLLQVGDVDLVVLCKLLISVRCLPGNPAQYINGNRLYLSELMEIM